MKEVFASYEFGMIGLMFFFGLFMLILLWVLQPAMKAKFERYANIPLEDD